MALLTDDKSFFSETCALCLPMSPMYFHFIDFGRLDRSFPLSAVRRVVSILRQESPEPVNFLKLNPFKLHGQQEFSTNT